jgi:hypothetical protein
MRQEVPGRGGPLGPLDWRKVLPFEPCATSDRPEWAGLDAARFRAASASELNVPDLTHHRLVLITRPPEELDLRYEGVKRHVPPPAGSILQVPAGSPAWWRRGGRMETLIVFLEPGLVARVAAEAFGLDPAHTEEVIADARAEATLTTSQGTAGGGPVFETPVRRPSTPGSRRPDPRQPAARGRGVNPAIVPRTSWGCAVRVVPTRAARVGSSINGSKGSCGPRAARLSC